MGNVGSDQATSPKEGVNCDRRESADRAAMHFDIELKPGQIDEIRALPAGAWFTPVRFRNAESPVHPQAARLNRNHQKKYEMVADWIRKYTPGKRVLDLFSANGAFSFMAARAGATSVVGMEFDAERVEAANLVWSILRPEFPDTELEIVAGDVYELGRRFTGPFDVVMCFGGLYHIADPPYVLRQIRPLTRELLLMQTSAILPGRRNRARFRVRRDRRGEGLSSIVGGSGRWFLSQKCLELILRHAGFEAIESKRPNGWRARRRFPFVERFPWYAAVCRPN